MATTKKRMPQQLVKLLDASHPMFWVSVFSKEVQELDALIALHHEMHRRRRSRVVTMALCSAVYNKSELLSENVNKCVGDGVLLFCFDGTTALQGGAA